MIKEIEASKSNNNILETNNKRTEKEGLKP